MRRRYGKSLMGEKSRQLSFMRSKRMLIAIQGGEHSTGVVHMMDYAFFLRVRILLDDFGSKRTKLFALTKEQRDQQPRIALFF